MPHVTTIESALSASRLDIDDQRHAISESKMRAMIDVLRPLADSFEVYITR
jgi:hypothetical protein